MAEPSIKMSMTIDGQVVQIPAFHVQAIRSRKPRGAGRHVFLDNRNNPVLIQYSLQFTGKSTPRTERIVSVTAGPEMQAAMAQSLATVREYTPAASISISTRRHPAQSSGLLDEIAKTLNDNPLWTLEDYRPHRFDRRSHVQQEAVVCARPVGEGCTGQARHPAARLTVGGAGATEPVAKNKTLEGRALNRRVVLTRTDR